MSCRAQTKCSRSKKQIFTSPQSTSRRRGRCFALGEVNEGYHRNIVFYTNGDGYNGVGTLSDSQKAQENH